MDAVYRVWGSNLGDGACLLAESEGEAIEIISEHFKLEAGDLRAALDKTVSIPSRGIYLDGSGKTDYVRG